MNDPEADRATTQPAEPGRRAAGHKGPAARHLTQLWGVSFGDAALASFVLCAVSGVLLLPAFDARDGARSIALWLLANPGATVLRNLHYWTAQACLVLTLLHAWDHLRRGREGRLARGVWLRLVASLPVLAFLMLSGFLLRGDADAQQARRILKKCWACCRWPGLALVQFLLGTDGASLQVWCCTTPPPPPSSSGWWWWNTPGASGAGCVPGCWSCWAAAPWRCWCRRGFTTA
jgi:quinol-cytochrome oxidoreductase complex cytochrome b subunit